AGMRVFRSTPARAGFERGLRGHAADEATAELVPPLTRRRLGEPDQGLIDRRALGVAQLVLGEERCRRALELGEKFRIDHHAPYQLSQPLRHGRIIPISPTV